MSIKWQSRSGEEDGAVDYLKRLYKVRLLRRRLTTQPASLELHPTRQVWVDGVNFIESIAC